MDPAEAKAAAQALADQRLADLAAKPGVEPAIADYIRAVSAIAVEYSVPPTDEAKRKTLDQMILDAQAARETFCTSDGQGGREPGSFLTSMREVTLNEAAEKYRDENGLDDATSTVVAGRVLTAVESKLCTGQAAGA